jgi:hypothetical protein
MRCCRERPAHVWGGCGRVPCFNPLHARMCRRTGRPASSGLASRRPREGGAVASSSAMNSGCGLRGFCGLF